MRDGRGSCLDSRRLGSITCRPGSGTVGPSPSSGHGLITGVCTGNNREAGECPKRHLRATTSYVGSTQMADVVFPREQVPHDAAGHLHQWRCPRCLPWLPAPVPHRPADGLGHSPHRPNVCGCGPRRPGHLPQPWHIIAPDVTGVEAVWPSLARWRQRRTPA